MNEINEAVKEFLIESHENLEQLDSDLVALEKDPAGARTIGSIFRTVHTLKGSAGFLALKKLEAVTHVGETLLGRLRDKKLPITPEVITVLLRMVDAVRGMLAAVEATGTDGDNGHPDLIALLKRHAEGKPGGPTSIPGPAQPSRLPSREVDRTLMLKPASAGSELSEPSPAAGQAEREMSALLDTTIRLDVGLLDKLMNLVSELVLARNQIVQCAAANPDAMLAGAARHLNLITSELQQEVMATRMQAIGTIWSKFPRVVRDLARECGKQVRLEIEGAETELDKSVIEAIKDPLTHLVRNAVDHGLESPDARQRASKPPEGRLFLRAYHEGGQVHLEIGDDGAGIDVERVRRKALERGLISGEQAARMSEAAVLGLIFHPGFSTADKVTNVSGRGIGMDVVKTNVEKIGGAVDLQSKAGTGTTVKMRIPLTLAIIRAIIVVQHGQRFALPQTSMIELIRLEGAKARAALERVHDATVYRFRGKVVPVVFLSRVLGEPDPAESDAVHLIILQAEDRQFGLVVDRILDTQEIVVKPLGSMLRGISCYAGATLMGDGRVALILDVLGLAERVAVLVRSQQFRRLEAESPEGGPQAETMQRLVLVSGAGQRFAVPLEQVSRLEEFPATAIERTGSRRVVQYRGRILPLVDVPALLDNRSPPDTAPPPAVQVVVCGGGERSVGLVVERILDVVAAPLNVRTAAGRPNVLFTTVVDRQVTEVLDVDAIMQACA